MDRIDDRSGSSRQRADRALGALARRSLARTEDDGIVVRLLAYLGNDGE